MNRAEAFRILELPEGSTPQDAKRAYRRLAQKLHPDKPTGNAEKFKEIQAALQLIESGRSSDTASPHGFQSTWGSPQDFEEIFEELKRRTSSAYGTGRRGDRPKVDPIDDYAPNGQWGASGPGARSGGFKVHQLLSLQIAITLEEAFTGCRKTINGLPDQSKISGTSTQIDIPGGLVDGQQFKQIELPEYTIVLSVRINAGQRKVQYPGPFAVNGAGSIIDFKELPLITVLAGGSFSYTTIDGADLFVHVPAGLPVGAMLKVAGKGYWTGNDRKTRGDVLIRCTPTIKPLSSWSEAEFTELQTLLKDEETRRTEETKQ